MPNATITFYLKDSKYSIYVDNKKEINAKVREVAKKLIDQYDEANV